LPTPNHGQQAAASQVLHKLREPRLVGVDHWLRRGAGVGVEVAQLAFPRCEEGVEGELQGGIVRERGEDSRALSGIGQASLRELFQIL
jgi:hypothetical protein